MSSISIPADSAFVSPWGRALVLLGLSLALVLFTFWSTWAAMAGIWWHSATFAHGMVVYPVTAWLIWREHAVLRGITPAPLPWALVPFAALLLVWLGGTLGEAQVVQQFAVVAMPVVLCLVFLGPAVVRRLWFPLAFTVFAVPFGEGLVPLLMTFTAVFTAGAVELVGIPIYRDGMLFSLPSGDFEVARACSGIRYLIASTALGTVYAYLTYRSPWRRLAFLGLALLVPIVANGLRAFGIVMIAHFTDMRYAVGIDHIIYGWVFFGVVIFLLFWAGSLFREDDVAAAPSGSEGAGEAGTAPGAGAGVADAAHYPAARAGALLGATAVAAVLTLLVSRLLTGPLAGAAAAPTLAAPPADSPWRGPLTPTLAWEPSYPGATHVLRAAYERRRDGVRVEVAVVVHDPTGPGAATELVNSRNEVARDWAPLAPPERIAVTPAPPPAPGGAVADGGAAAEAIAEAPPRAPAAATRGAGAVASQRASVAAPRRVNAAVHERAGQGWVFWQWYVSGQRSVASEVLVKLDELTQAFMRRGRPAASIVVAAPRDDGGLRPPVLDAFTRDLGGRLARCATATRSLAQCAEAPR